MKRGHYDRPAHPAAPNDALTAEPTRHPNPSGVRRIAVLTSGGDAPGMNAAIRAVVRTATFEGIEVVGVRRGFSGLHRGELQILGPRDVANTIQRGGTILLTARSHTWRTRKAARAARSTCATGTWTA